MSFISDNHNTIQRPEASRSNIRRLFEKAAENDVEVLLWKTKRLRWNCTFWINKKSVDTQDGAKRQQMLSVVTVKSSKRYNR